VCTNNIYSDLERSEGGRRKQGNLERTVMSNIALQNVCFQSVRIILLNMFAHKESIMNRDNNLHLTVR
jgi:hypothetical protein